MSLIPKQDGKGLWQVVDNNGDVLAAGLSNAQAWRAIDKLQSEPTSPTQAKKEFRDKDPEPSQSEKQDFYSGLVQIAIDREYAPGWAWHKFHEKFKHTPEGLHRNPRTPSKQVWGWVNRKAIARSRVSKAPVYAMIGGAE
jgi:hypothetical protein